MADDISIIVSVDDKDLKNLIAQLGKATQMVGQQTQAFRSLERVAKATNTSLQNQRDTITRLAAAGMNYNSVLKGLKDDEKMARDAAEAHNKSLLGINKTYKSAKASADVFRQSLKAQADEQRRLDQVAKELIKRKKEQKQREEELIQKYGQNILVQRAYRKATQDITQALKMQIITQAEANKLYAKAEQDLTQMKNGVINAGNQFSRFNREIYVGRQNMRRFGNIELQQFGYQVGDFAVQVQSGTSALVALGQQGAQLLGIFGATGALAGAGLAIGTAVARTMLDLQSAAQKIEESFDGALESVSDLESVMGNISDSEFFDKFGSLKEDFKELSSLSKAVAENTAKLNLVQAGDALGGGALSSRGPSVFRPAAFGGVSINDILRQRTDPSESSLGGRLGVFDFQLVNRFKGAQKEAGARQLSTDLGGALSAGQLESYMKQLDQAETVKETNDVLMRLSSTLDNNRDKLSEANLEGLAFVQQIDDMAQATARFMAQLEDPEKPVGDQAGEIIRKSLRESARLGAKLIAQRTAARAGELALEEQTNKRRLDVIQQIRDAEKKFAKEEADRIAKAKAAQDKLDASAANANLIQMVKNNLLADELKYGKDSQQYRDAAVHSAGEIARIQAMSKGLSIALVREAELLAEEQQRTKFDLQDSADAAKVLAQELREAARAMTALGNVGDSVEAALVRANAQVAALSTGGDLGVAGRVAGLRDQNRRAMNEAIAAGGDMSSIMSEYTQTEGDIDALAKALQIIADSRGKTGGGDKLAKNYKEYLEGLRNELKIAEELKDVHGEEYKLQRDLLILKQKYGILVTTEDEAEVERAQRRIKEIQDQKALQEELADTISGSMGDAFTSIIDGTKSAKDAFGDMADYIVKELFRILVMEQMVQSIKSSILGTPAATEANGGVYRGGNRIAFANGGVVNGPTYFPMSRGRTGLMGEAGPEAIMPLERGSDGKLGVKASGGQSVVVNQSFNFSANGDDSVKRIIAQEAPKIADMTTATIMDQRRRGGAMRKAFN